MMVEDFETTREITKPADLDAVLGKRYGVGINSFWLADEAGKFPVINITVNGDVAYVHYFPNEDHPGFGSVARSPGPRPNETSVFFISPDERIWVPNGEIVAFSEALKAAQEFSISRTLPKCLQWRSLKFGE
jgi:hypothetical protein